MINIGPIPAPQVPGFTPRYRENTGMPILDQMHNSYNWQDAMIQMGRNKQDEQNPPGFITRFSRKAIDAGRYAEREFRPQDRPEPFGNIQDTFVPSTEPVDPGIYKPRHFSPRPVQLPPGK